VSGIPDDVLPMAKRMAQRRTEERPAPTPAPSERRRIHVSVSAVDLEVLRREALDESVRRGGRHVSLEAWVSSVVSEHCKRRKRERMGSGL
jgi:hypothetical protein